MLSPDQLLSELGERARQGAVWLTAGALVTVACFTVKDTVESLDSHGVKASQSQSAATVTITATPETSPDAYSSATEEDVQAVRDLLSEPADPVFQGLVVGQSSDYEQNATAKRERRYDIADQLGLQLIDTSSTTQDLQNKADDPKVPFSTFLKGANDALRQANIDIAVATKIDPNISEADDPKTKDLESIQSKYGIINLLQDFNDKPRKLYTDADIEHIRLYDSKANDRIAGFVTGLGGTGTVYLNISGGGMNGNTLDHESGHLIGSHEGKDIYTDPEFAAIHGPAPIYNDVQHDGVHANYESYMNKSSSLREQENQAIMLNDKDKYCAVRALDDKLAARVLSYSDYHPNVAEDNAELTEKILEPDSYYRILDPRSPVISAEAQRLLVRLYHFDSGVATYFIRTSVRDTQAAPIIDCPDPAVKVSP